MPAHRRRPTRLEVSITIVLLGLVAFVALMPIPQNTNFCGHAAMTGVKRAYHASTQSLEGNWQAASVHIAPGNRGLAWTTHGFRVVGAYLWEQTTTPERPLHLDEAQIQTLHASHSLATIVQTIKTSGQHAPLIRVQLCLVHS